MNKTVKGATFILLASASYGFYGIFSRMIGKSFGDFSQSWTRNTIILILVGLFLLLTKTWKTIERKDWKWMILWPLSDVVSIVLLYITFNNMSIGTSYFLFYASMIIGGFIFGKLLYKEKLNMLKITSIILSILGLIIIFTAEFSIEKIQFIIFGLLAGVSTALWNNLSKKVSDRYPNAQLVFVDASVALCATILGSLFIKDSVPALTNPAWIWQILFAVTQISAVAFVILGFRYLEAQLASIILPVEVIFAVFFGFVFLHEILLPKVFLGGLLIASAAILPHIHIFNDKIHLSKKL